MSSFGLVEALRVGAGASTDLDATVAAAEAAAEAAGPLGTTNPDLVVAFIASEHRDSAEDVASFLSERFPGSPVLGCVSDGVVAGHREIESGPAVSVFAGVLPDTNVVPFALDFVEREDGTGEYVGWPDDFSDGAAIISLCDPFSFPSVHFVSHLNADRPGTRVIGGVASGAHSPGEARLLLGGSVRSSGAVAVAVSGRVRVETLVSQGCRPIGEPVTITRADRNIIFELAGARPVDFIQSLWRTSRPHDRALMVNAPLFIGRVVDEYKTDFGRGDFVIRNVVGADSNSGVIAVADVVEIGEMIQFHVRDPDAASEELRELLGAVESHPVGALLFTCNGRGSNMFEEPDHDATLVQKELGGVPLAGFFANGELGPVGGKNFLHGHTASLALFVDSGAQIGG